MKKILALGYLAGVLGFLVVLNMYELSFWPAAIVLVVSKVVFTVPILISDYNKGKTDFLRFLPLFQGVAIQNKGIKGMSVSAGALTLVTALLIIVGLTIENDPVFIAGLVTLGFAQLLNGLSRSAMILAVAKRNKKKKATHEVVKLLMCAILFVPLLDSVGMIYPMFLSMGNSQVGE